MNFENKSFVVVGGGRTDGICFNIVKQLIAGGTKRIAVLDLLNPKMELDHQGAEISFHKVDVRNKDEIFNALTKVTKSFGNIDILINGAGILRESSIEDTLHVNLFGVIYGCQAAIEHMSIENGGRGGIIINIASVAGLDSYFNAPAYCASKHGVIGYTRSLADEKLQPKFGIKFISICPGATETKLMKEMNKDVFKPEMLTETMQVFKEIGIQTSETCAKLILTSIGQSKNGSVWIVDRSNLQPVHFKKHCM